MGRLFENSYLSIALECALTLLITYAAQRLVRLIFKRVEKKGIHLRFLSDVIVGVVWVVGCFAAMATIPGLSSLARTLLAGSGIVAIVVGLAAQDSFGNLFSGLFISLFRPFEIGDRVKLVKSNITGFVEDITLRHTVIRTLVNSRVIIPNSTINSEIIENSNYATTVASSFLDISISYESDLELARRLMAELIGAHELYLDQRTPEDIAAGKPKVAVLVRALGESGVDLRASVWTRTIDDNFTACSDLRIRIMQAFRENGIEIPYKHVVVKAG